MYPELKGKREKHGLPFASLCIVFPQHRCIMNLSMIFDLFLSFDLISSQTIPNSCWFDIFNTYGIHPSIFTSIMAVIIPDCYYHWTTLLTTLPDSNFSYFPGILSVFVKSLSCNITVPAVPLCLLNASSFSLVYQALYQPSCSVFQEDPGSWSKIVTRTVSVSSRHLLSSHIFVFPTPLPLLSLPCLVHSACPHPPLQLKSSLPPVKGEKECTLVPSNKH